MSALSPRTLARAVIAISLALAPVAPARAQNPTDDERARTHFSAGRSYYEEGNYERALEEFQRSYELSRRDVLLVNIANAQERLGQWREAAATLEQFVATLPEGHEQRPVLARRVENLRSRAEQREAELRAAEQREAEQREAELRAREAEVRAAAEASEQESGVALTTATTGASDGLLVPSLVAFGVGAAGLATFATLGSLAIVERDRIADGCGENRSCTPDQVRAMDDYALGADIALTIGLVAAATGAVLIIVDPPRDGSTESASVRLVPYGDAHGAGLAIQGSF